MSHKMLRQFIVKVSVLDYFPLTKVYNNYKVYILYYDIMLTYLHS